MALMRRKSGTSPGWLQAVAFNGLLIVLPLLAASAVAGVFNSRDYPDEPTAAAVSETRSALDDALAALVPRGADRRAFWADLVDRELTARDLAAARGFLLAAPQLLDPGDVAALEAAARNDPFGTRDQKQIRAALLFLPNDVRARYDLAVSPPADAGAEAGGAATLTPPLAVPDDDAAAAPARAADLLSERTFSVLGSLEDLTRNSRRWVRTERGPSTELRLTGLGLVGEDVPPADTVHLAQALSILKAAYRAGRLTESYAARLDRQVDAALPEDDLRAALSQVFEGVSTTSEQMAGVEAAFRNVLQPNALDELVADARQVNAVANAITSVATVALLEHVDGATDLRRMRLVVEAGNDRAVALEKQSGEAVLEVARTGADLSGLTVLQIMGMAAAAMALFWLTLAAMQRSFRGEETQLPYL